MAETGRAAARLITESGKRPAGPQVGRPDASLADALFDSSLDCVKILDLDGTLRRINDFGCQSLEVCDPEAAIGTNYFDFWSGSDQDVARDAAGAALMTGSGRFTATYVSPSGKVSIWDEALTLVRDAAGQPEALVVVSRDLTALNKQLAQNSALADLGALALSDADFDTVLQAITDRLCRIFDCRFSKVLEFVDNTDCLLMRAGTGWHTGLVGRATVGIDLDSQAGYTLRVNGPVVVRDLATEKRFSGPLLLRQHKVRSGMSTIIPGPGPRIYGILGVHADTLRNFDQSDIDVLNAVANIIASRWRQEHAEANRSLLLREVAHRSGNLLQVVNSIFRQTVQSLDDVDEAKRIFSERLCAMARTSMSLAKEHWSRMSIAALASDVFEPFGDKVRISGEDLMVDGEDCFDISMIWHELATNAAKYGSLGADGGEVLLDWQVEGTGADRMLMIHWQDTQASREVRDIGTGFGAKLIRQLVETKRGGRVTIAQQPVYSCRIRLPLQTT